MKSTVVLLAMLFLVSACVTNRYQPEPVISYSEFDFGVGMEYSKPDFNLKNFKERSGICYNATASTSMINNPLSQQERYESCMRTGDYKLVSLSQSEISKRKQATNEYIEERTFSEGKFFDKENFQDRLYVSDMHDCGNEAIKIEKNTVTPIYSPNADTAFFNSIFAGIEGGRRHRETQTEYAKNCMFKKGYVFNYLPKEEIERRQYLLK